MKIGMIANSMFRIPPEAYGGEIFVWDLVESMGNMGHEVYLFARHDSFTPPNGKVIPLSKTGGDFRTSLDIEIGIPDLYSNILEEVDIVHDFGHLKFTAQFCYEKNIPCLNTLWGACLSICPRPVYNTVVWANAHKIAAGVPNAEVIYGGVNTDFYYPDYDKEDYFLYVARPHPHKGAGIAISIAKRTGINLKLAWRAQSWDHFHYEKQYEELIKGFDNIEIIKLPIKNHHEVKRSLYQKAKALFVPVNYDECFGLVFAEAMSCGTPCITTTRCALPEVVRNGVTGFTCHVKGHVSEINENLESRLIHAIKMIDNINPRDCREHVLKNFTRERAAKDYLNLYKEVIDGKLWFG